MEALNNVWILKFIYGGPESSSSCVISEIEFLTEKEAVEFMERMEGSTVSSLWCQVVCNNFRDTDSGLVGLKYPLKRISEQVFCEIFGVSVRKILEDRGYFSEESSKENKMVWFLLENKYKATTFLLLLFSIACSERYIKCGEFCQSIPILRDFFDGLEKMEELMNWVIGGLKN